MAGNMWQLQDAKNKFCYLVNRAQKEGPQIVTKHGKEAVVVMAIDDYKKLSKPKTDLYRFFQNSPLANSDHKIERNKDIPGKTIEMVDKQ